MTQPALKDRDTFLAERLRGIGGSDAASVLGLGRRSPLELYAIKTGMLEEEDLSDNERVHFGNVLEGVIAEEYQRRTGREVFRDDSALALKVHPEHDFMICHPDGILADERKSGPGVLEIKTADAYRASDWDEEPPVEYQIQLQHNLVVMGLQWGSFAVLFGGNRFQWLDVELNPRFTGVLMEREAKFWGQVLRLEPPPLSKVEQDARALAALFPTPTSDDSIALPPESMEWDRARLDAAEGIKQLQAIKKEAENNLKLALGDHALGTMQDGTSYSWKETHRKGYTVEATTFRALRRHKARR